MKTKENIWRKEETAWIIENYPSLGTEVCAEKLCRSKKSVRRKAKRLSLRLNDPSKKSWSKNDTEWFTENFSNIGYEESAKKLNRTVKSIRHKATILNLKYTPKIKERKTCTCCEIEKFLEDFCKVACIKSGYGSICNECKKTKSKNYSSSDKIRVRDRIRNQLYRQRNKERVNRLSRERILTDENFRLKINIRRRITLALKQDKKEHTIDLLGCSIPQLKLYLESKFEPQMTWSNYGKFWHLDHCVGLTMFDLTLEEDRFIAFNFSNQMPRWATTEIAIAHGSKQIGNIEKGNRLVDNSYYHLLTNPS